MLLTGADNFEEILKTELEMSYHNIMSKQETCLATAKLNLEIKILLKHAGSLAEFQNTVDDQALH